MKKFKIALTFMGLALTAGLMVLSCGDEEGAVVTPPEVCEPTAGGWTEAWCTDGIDNDCDELIDEDDVEECLPEECKDKINPNVPDPFQFYGALPTGTISSGTKLEEILGQAHRFLFNPAPIYDYVTVYIDMFLIGFELGEIARDWVVGQDCYELLRDTLPPDCDAVTDCKIEEDFGKATLDFGSGCEFKGEAGIGGVAADTFGRTTVTISGGLEIVGYLKRDPSTGEPETVKVSGEATDFSDGPNIFNCGIIEAYVDYDPAQDSVSRMPVLITMNGVFDGEPIAIAINAPNSLFRPGATYYYIDSEGDIYTVHAFGGELKAGLIEALDAPGGDVCGITLDWGSGSNWNITEDTCDTGIAGPITGPNMTP